MNTIRSVSYGWGGLIVAGAGAYILAKQSLNDDKKARVNADKTYEAQQAQLRQQEARFRAEMHFDEKESAAALLKKTSTQPALEKSKYSPTEVYKSPKGNRL